MSIVWRNPNVEPPCGGRNYFQTTYLQETDLFRAESAALEQNELVMAIFRRKRRALTPWEVWQEGAKNGRQWLITSVRRSMSVLSSGEGPALVKLNSLRMGPHGKPSHEWALPEQVLSSSEQLTDGSEKADSGSCTTTNG